MSMVEPAGQVTMAEQAGLKTTSVVQNGLKIPTEDTQQKNTTDQQNCNKRH